MKNDNYIIKKLKMWGSIFIIQKFNYPFVLEHSDTNNRAIDSHFEFWNIVLGESERSMLEETKVLHSMLILCVDTSLGRMFYRLWDRRYEGKERENNFLTCYPFYICKGPAKNAFWSIAAALLRRLESGL